ncbi:hypothetical protein T12_16217 [Trichinella patagoniensis]|uniref:Uncharacterized protein n=1 Tax=Trichinella patagoniensis TaxID=990121 RepID=A0A0V1AAU5_9BILA|nr:hypothetical protein T12_16217 [Trichinella patagoniensis]
MRLRLSIDYEFMCCKVEKRGCNYYLPQIPEIAFLNTGLLHASAWLPFGYPVRLSVVSLFTGHFSRTLFSIRFRKRDDQHTFYYIYSLAVVTAAAARSLRKYAKHASSCFIQCCVRRGGRGVCLLHFATSLRRQDGIFRCPKISKKCRSECAHKGWRVVSGVCACAMYAVTITLAKQIVCVCPFGDFNVQFALRSFAFFHTCLLAAMITCRYVRWLINLLPLQLPRASKRSVKRLIQPFRQYPLQEMFEGRFVAVAVAAGVVAIVVGFQGKSKRKKQQYPSVFEILRFYLLFNIAVAGEEEHGIFTAASK